MKEDTMNPRNWPSTRGPSVFLDDPRYHTPEYALCRKVEGEIGESIDWDDFRVLHKAVGAKEIREAVGLSTREAA